MSGITEVCDLSEELVISAIGCEGFDDFVDSVIDALYDVLENAEGIEYAGNRNYVLDTIDDLGGFK